jgi:hypothetical protein
MSNLANYFSERGYKSKYHIGDRVQGTWNKIPFRGTVGNDTCVDGVNPRVSVHSDLPIKFKDRVHNVIFVKPSELKPFK